MNNAEKALAYAQEKNWRQAEESLAEHISTLSDVQDLHFTYNQIIEYSYKQRKADSEAISRCLRYCIEDITILPAFRKKWDRQFGDFEQIRIPSIDRATRILEKEERYEELESLLQQIASVYGATETAQFYRDEMKRIRRLSMSPLQHSESKKKPTAKTASQISVEQDDISSLPLKEIIRHFIKTEWSCELSFSKSKSRNYEQAVQLARQAPRYGESPLDNGIIHLATYGPQPDSYLAMLRLWEIAKEFKSSTIRINRHFLDRKAFAQLNMCYGDRCRAGKDFCYGASVFTQNPLGCHRARIHISGDPWYKFGIIDSEGVFHLDRNKLTTEIVKRLIPYRFCPALQIELLIRNILKLPETIDPHREAGWQYTTYLDTQTGTEYKGLTRSNI